MRPRTESEVKADMASDSFTTLGPSDSGFLNSFFTPTPSTPLQSRVGEPPPHNPAESGDAPDSESVLEEEPTIEGRVAEDPPGAEACAGLAEDQIDEAQTGESPIGGQLVEGQLVEGELTDGQLDAALRAAPLPEGFLSRLRQVVD